MVCLINGVMNYILLICSLTFLVSSLGLVYSKRNCSAVDNWLPCDEVDAIVSFFDDLYLDIDLDSISSRESACDQSISKNYFSCNCSVHPSDKQCHVDTITLNSNIEGQINEDVGKLKYLTGIDLDSNKLSGLIPESLGNLSRLQYLDLSTNKLSGQIPQALGNLSSLTYLRLSYNFLNGTIPSSLGELSSLQYLSLAYNNLTGRIPAALGNLVNLQYLYLFENQLFGPLPPRLSTNLTKLHLASNNLTGPIPDTYRGLMSLMYFEVSGNHLAGPIPSFIANWSSLNYLKLSGNHFESIAPEIFGMSSLATLIISDVPSNGEFELPYNMTALTHLRTLVLRNCSITGPLHSTISMLSKLNKLDLSHNNFTGDLSAVENLNSTVILLQNNSLTGRIPPKLLGRQKNDSILRDFSYNDFTEASNEQHGKLTYTKPNSMDITLRKRQCHKSKHNYHSLHINCGGGQVAINKTLVYEADKSTSNSEMYGRWGYSCSGSYSSETLSLPLPLPSYYLESSTCGVSGSSSDLYQESRLCPTSLRYFAFCLRKGKYEVKLHFRDTVFASDDDYTSYGKRVFDVYVQGNRNLTNFYLRENINRPGNVSEQTIHTHVDDDGFLDILLYWPGLGSSIPPNALHGPIISAISVNPLFTVGLKTWEKAVIGATSALFLLLLLVFVLWWTGVIGDKKLREKSIAIRDKQYTVKQVVKGTQNFSPKTKIGKGSFGTVYKSELPNGGPLVAVKKLSFQTNQKKKQEVQSEVYLLRELKHDNLVELFGGYYDPSRKLHLLVYEYMENKSIAHALFDPNFELELDWITRYNIFLGMAKGLEYLHNSRFKIVHRNIKSSNILLDGNMKAKISDLGLAKLFEEENPYISLGSTGQIYRAPEYATRNAITDKADVYSFGVVLLEIVSGKSNADFKDAQEAEFLLDKACVLQSKGRLIDLVDSKLLSDQTYDRKQAIKVLDLAMMCLDQSHKLRPNMSQVVGVLEDHISIQQLSKETNPST